MNDMDKMLEEMIKKRADEIITKTTEKYLKDIFSKSIVQETITNVINEKIENMLDEGDDKGVDKLEVMITNSLKPSIMDWVELNMYGEDIEECIKKAILHKFKKYGVKELSEMIQNMRSRKGDD